MSYESENYKILDLSRGTKGLDPKRHCKVLVIQLDKDGKNAISIEFFGGTERTDVPFIKNITDVRIEIKKNDWVDTALTSNIKNFYPPRKN